VLRRSATNLTGRPRRSRTVESLEGRCFLAVALGPEMPIQPPAAPFELRADTAPIERPANDGPSEQRTVALSFEKGTDAASVERPANDGPLEQRTVVVLFEQRADAVPRNSIDNTRPGPQLQHDSANDDLSNVTVNDVGPHTERLPLAPGFQSSAVLLLPSGLSQPRVEDGLRDDAKGSNGADVQSEPRVAEETPLLAPLSAHDAVFARFGADGGYHFDVVTVALRPGPIPGLESRPQPLAIQATGNIQHTHDDANPQDFDAQFAGGTFATSSVTATPSMTKSGFAGAADETLRSSPTNTPLDASAFADDLNGFTLDRVIFATAPHYLLMQRVAAQGALLVAATIHDVDVPLQWSSALPLAPRLSIDAQQLDQALEAVLADIDELGGTITGSLTDGNRVYWGLAAGSAACYFAGRRFQLDADAASQAQRGERVSARRLFGWLSLRYPFAR
jgi:hypothetical protein